MSFAELRVIAKELKKIELSDQNYKELGIERRKNYRINRRDMIENIITKTDIQEKMYKDKITWLYNNDALEEIKKINKNYSVIMMDADKFKEINDKYLHSGWNLVLQKIWKIINSSIRTDMWDKAFRHWGDEFLILIPEWDITTLEKIVSRIEKKIKEAELYINWDKIDISLSFWIHKKDALSLNDTIKKADEQLNNNKNGEWDFYRTKKKIEDIKSPEKTKELINIGLDKLDEEKKVDILKEVIESLESPELLKLIKSTTEEALSKIKKADYS